MASTLGGKRNVKVYILYLMINVGYPLEFASLNDMVRQNDYVMYLDFEEAFHELRESALVTTAGKNKHGEDLFIVTREGKIIADSFKSDILPSILDKSLADALRYLDFQRRGIVSSCTVEKLSDGRAKVVCSLTENKEIIFRTELVVDSLNRAERMKANFNEHPEVVYKGALALTTGNVNYMMIPQNK
ncbi:MAG: DUF4364 family protein [Clostridia bacterium]|nr:DUF4364 family protein [Clostridia bacterium]